MDNLREQIYLGALLHDIGKFWQRGTDYELKGFEHEKLSGFFTNRFFKNDLISDIVNYHHIEDLRKANLNTEHKIIASIVCEADSLASGERGRDMKVNVQQNLKNIFSEIYLKGKKEFIKESFQQLSQLNINDYSFPAPQSRQDELSKLYQDNWDNFLSEIAANAGINFETLLLLLKKYLWCVPSASWKTDPDIPLYEHSRLTAAIAVSMYDFMMEKHSSGLEIKEIDNRLEERYLLMCADLTGIQSYIFKIGHKGALRALKGRSFILQQILDSIARKILNELHLNLSHLLYSSGGKFYVILPKTEFVEEELPEMEGKITQALFNEYGTDIGCVFAWLPLKGINFIQKENRNPKNDIEKEISEIWDILSKRTDAKKKRKNISVLNDQKIAFFQPYSSSGSVIQCYSTGKDICEKVQLISFNERKVSIGPAEFKEYFINNESIVFELLDEGKPTETYYSPEQYMAQRIGFELKKDNNRTILSGNDREFSILGFEKIGFTASPAQNGNIDYQIKLNGNEEFINKNTEVTSLWKFYGGTWSLEDFDTIEKTLDLKRFAVLRMDVDNLGLIFRNGFKYTDNGKIKNNATLSRVVQLSSMLDYFFSGYLNKIEKLYWDIEKGITDKKTDIALKDTVQIVYSGGDDLFILGTWNVIPDLALSINNEFRNFTFDNPYLNLSAGIAMFHTSMPVFKVAQLAGDAENKAKSFRRKDPKNDGGYVDKNAVCFMDISLSWHDFQIVRQMVLDFYHWMKPGNNGKKLPKAFLQRLMDFNAEYNENEKKIFTELNKGKEDLTNKEIRKLKEEAKEKAKYSPVRWRATYSLFRLAKQYREFEQEIKSFATRLFTNMDKTEQDLITLIPLAARWTELLLRKKEE